MDGMDFSLPRALPLTVPLGRRETATSFCSRLARRNTCVTARQFCQEMGLDFKLLISGKPDQLPRLAALGGVDADLLARWSFTSRALPHLQAFELAGQLVNLSMVTRGMNRVCPLCLRDDLATAPELGALAMFQRAEWTLLSIRSCPFHGVALVDATENGAHGGAASNFAGFAEEVLHRLDDLVREAMPWGASRLETYIMERLAGSSAHAHRWLDEQPLYVAVRLSEVVGVMEGFGRDTRDSELSEQDMHRAGDLGYGLLETGIPGFEAFLDRSIEAGMTDGTESGMSNICGRLYRWLAVNNGDNPDYDGIRERLRERMVSLLPLEPGTMVFDRPVESRRVWSVTSAAQFTGIRPKPLHGLLLNRGILPAERLTRQPRGVRFPADPETDAFLEELRGAIDAKEVRHLLNVPVHAIRHFHDQGIIKAVAITGADTKAHHYYSRTVIEEFAERVMAGCHDGPGPEGLVDLHTALKAAHCEYETMFRLLAEKRLERTGRQTGETGFASILVDAAEVKERMVEESKRDKGDLSATDVWKRMGWTFYIMETVIKSGLLPFSETLNPLNKRKQRLFKTDDVADFNNKYIRLADLAKIKGIGYPTLWSILREEGIYPVIDGGQYSHEFYLRTDVM